MPTYEYECQGCGKSTEIFHGISEAPKKKCPHCGKLRLKRLIGSGSGFLFKGSGFYITDYRSDDYTSKAKAEKDAGKTDKSDRSDKSDKSGTSDSGKSDKTSGADKPSASDSQPKGGGGSGDPAGKGGSSESGGKSAASS